jgi:FeS assembly SUF system protein
VIPDAVTTQELRPRIEEALATVFDPEIPVNIYELGLIYDIAADAAGVVRIEMTLTSPGCPSAQSLPPEVAQKVRELPGVTDCQVDVVWDPPWDKDRMTDAAKLALGLL